MNAPPLNLNVRSVPEDFRGERARGRRVELNRLMNRELASGVDLQMQLRQASWNMRGPDAVGLRELIDKVNPAVASYLDMIAERIAQLGGVAEGTVRVSASRSRLPEYPMAIVGAAAHLDAVAHGIAWFGGEVRGTIDEATALGDPDTADLFAQISRGFDNWLWFVLAHSRTSTRVMPGTAS